MKYDVFIYDKNHIIPDEQVGFTNIICFYKGEWLYVRGKGKDTWELPGGHREEGESILECAKRELFEETGITKYELFHISSRKLIEKATGKSHHGFVYIAKVVEIGERPESEIEEVKWFPLQPSNLTYPFIQIDLHNIALNYYKQNTNLFD